MGAEGSKFDGDKLRYDLLQRLALEKLVAVSTMGANKYGDRDWEKGIAYGRIFAAAQRHLWAFQRGEELDAESGLPHLAHAAWNCLTLLEFQLSGAGVRMGLDDRFKGSVVQDPNYDPDKDVGICSKCGAFIRGGIGHADSCKP